MRQLTPSQIASIERHKSFHAAIAARAVIQRQEASKAVCEPIKEKALVLKPMPPIEPSIVWPVIPEPKRILVARIMEIVAKDFNCSVKDIMSVHRTRDVVVPRQVAVYLARELTPYSTLQIGRQFGRDHSTILNSIRKTRLKISECEKFATFVSAIRAKCECL